MINFPDSYEYDPEKDALLKLHRGLGFEDMISCIMAGDVIEVSKHPNHDRYPNQHIIDVLNNGYVYRIPCIILEDRTVLKTLYPCRKATERWRKRHEIPG